jgi:hypothetical protein
MREQGSEVNEDSASCGKPALAWYRKLWQAEFTRTTKFGGARLGAIAKEGTS